MDCDACSDAIRNGRADSRTRWAGARPAAKGNKMSGRAAFAVELNSAKSAFAKCTRASWPLFPKSASYGFSQLTRPRTTDVNRRTLGAGSSIGYHAKESNSHAFPANESHSRKDRA